MNKTVQKLKELKDKLFNLTYKKQYETIINILNEAEAQEALDYVYYDSGIITDDDIEILIDEIIEILKDE